MILAADLGTSSLKAALLSRDGRLKARVRVPYRHAAGLEKGSFDVLEWETAFRRALKQLPPAKVSVVAVSGNGPTLIPCNNAGRPVGEASLWLYPRALPLDGVDSYYLPRAAWFREKDKRVWSRTRLLLSCPEWLYYQLTGRAVMTLPHNSFRRFIWNDAQLDRCGFDRSLFPEMVFMGSEAGRISAGAASRFSLEEGVPVAAAGSDFMAALLGSGAVKPGMVCDRAGTSEGINVCSEAPAEDKKLRNLPHVVEGLWNVAAILSSTGAVFEWYRRLTGQQGRAYEDTLAEIDSVPAGQTAPLFFPGGRNDELWEFGGGSFHSLEPGHGRAEMGRAVLEAIGYAVRRSVELLEAAGLPVGGLRVCGGQARGMVWNQMKADICGKTIYVPRIEDAELAGCGACALNVLGEAGSLLEAAERFIDIRHVIEPRGEINRKYTETYAAYRELAVSVA